VAVVPFTLGETDRTIGSPVIRWADLVTRSLRVLSDHLRRGCYFHRIRRTKSCQKEGRASRNFGEALRIAFT
jgi:hypothetical protein